MPLLRDTCLLSSLSPWSGMSALRGYIQGSKGSSKSISPEGIFNDILGRARTGTGNTLAFLIPAINAVLFSSNPRGIQVVVVSPTRELAITSGRKPIRC
jgi:ATP-dependent RNA helicase DDX18/HAS1